MEFLSKRYFITLLCWTILIGGCGGDGDGSGGIPRAPSDPIPITNNNADQVAATSVDAGFVDSATNATRAVMSADNSDKNSLKSNLKKIINLTKSENSAIVTSKSSLAAEAGPQCVSGSATAPEGITGVFAFDNCVTPDGETINGSIIVSGTAAADESSFDGSMTVNNFSFSADGSVVKMNGKIEMSFTTNGSVESGNITIGFFAFQFDDEVFELVDYNFDYQDSNSSAPDAVSTESFGFTLNSTWLNGSIHVETLQMLKYYGFNEYPFEGQVKTTGANNSSILVTVVSGGTGIYTDLVKVEVDEDGNGDYETSTTVSWLQLENSSTI